MANKKTRLSKISALHYLKFVGRSVLFLAALVFYVIHRLTEGTAADGMGLSALQNDPYLLGFIATVFFVEMLLRFFPSKNESMGCQKQFGRNFIPTGVEKPPKRSPWPIFFIVLFWVALNGAIGALYFTGIIDKGILVLICLAYSICDMICILFFCPFQTWLMKNKCCGSCRIYNWDFAMMFTPLAFIPHHPYAWILLGTALIHLAVWEILLLTHPERFFEVSNGCLSCANCPEKLCHHKKQLRGFLKKNRHRFFASEQNGAPYEK